MQLTIEQALQQAIAAHNDGKLNEAENIYRAILQSQPNHPDANHNLGLIAVSVNQVEAAIPLFKTALDINPNIELFWLSYVEALARAERLKDAKHAIKKPKKKGSMQRNWRHYSLNHNVEARVVPRFTSTWEIRYLD